jgi:hypothetical protein
MWGANGHLSHPERILASVQHAPLRLGVSNAHKKHIKKSSLDCANRTKIAPAAASENARRFGAPVIRRMAAHGGFGIFRSWIWPAQC